LGICRATGLGFGDASGWLGSSASVLAATRRSSNGVGKLGAGAHQSLSRRPPCASQWGREQGKRGRGGGVRLTRVAHMVVKEVGVGGKQAGGLGG
jgi:hypothetical protein